MPKRTRYRLPTTQLEITKACQALSDLGKTEKAILVELSDYANGFGSCFPKQETLANRSGYSVRSVQRALGQLEQIGLVRRAVRQGKGCFNRSSYYAVVSSFGEPTRHHVEAIRQLVLEEGDTVADNNKPIEQTKEDGWRLVALVENRLLQVFDPVVDLKRTPELICLGEVSQWLFNGHEPSDFGAALEKLFHDARLVMQASYRRGETLTGWTPLMDQLLKPPPTDEPSQLQRPLPPDFDPFIYGVLGLDRSDHPYGPQLRDAFNRTGARTDETGIRFTAPGRYELDYIITHCQSEFSEWAKRTGKRVEFYHLGQCVTVIK